MLREDTKEILLIRTSKAGRGVAENINRSWEGAFSTSESHQKISNPVKHKKGSHLGRYDLPCTVSTEEMWSVCAYFQRAEFCGLGDCRFWIQKRVWLWLWLLVSYNVMSECSGKVCTCCHEPRNTKDAPTTRPVEWFQQSAQVGEKFDEIIDEKMFWWV